VVGLVSCCLVRREASRWIELRPGTVGKIHDIGGTVAVSRSGAYDLRSWDATPRGGGADIVEPPVVRIDDGGKVRVYVVAAVGDSGPLASGGVECIRCMLGFHLHILEDLGANR